MNKSYVVVAGNPVSGADVYGPFVYADEARAWAQHHCNAGEGNVTELRMPPDAWVDGEESFTPRQSFKDSTEELSS